MIDLKIEVDDEVMEFTVPESWADVTVGQYVDSVNLNREGLSDIDLMIEMLSIFSNVDREISEMMDYESFNKLVMTFQFLEKEITNVVKDFVELDGETYFLKKDFESLTMGELISIEAIIAKYEDLTKAMPELLCIFLRKKTKKGKLEKFKTSMMGRAEMFKKVSIEEVHQIFFYFSDGKNISSGNMKDSLENKEK